MNTQFYFNNVEASLACQLISAKWQELETVLRTVPVPVYPDKSSKQRSKGLDLVQPMLNALIAHWMEGLGWAAQTKVNSVMKGLDKDAGTLDFTHRLPDGRYIAVEVQFANGGRLERDFYKFGQLHSKGLLALGIVVYMDRKTAKTADSGLAVFETAVDRKGAHQDMPLCLVGLGRHDAPEVDVSVIPDVVFPTVLGGSGDGCEDVRAFVAKAIVNDEDLTELRLPKRLKQVVRHEALSHVHKNIEAVKADLDRIQLCSSPSLREELMHVLATFFRSSYNVPGLQRYLKQQARLQARQDLGLSEDGGAPVSEATPSLTPGVSMGAAPLSRTPAARVVSPLGLMPAYVAADEVPLGGLKPPEPAREKTSTVSEAVRAEYPLAGGRRVPKAQLTVPAATPKRFVPTPRKDYPVAHCAMAGAFARAFARA